MACSFSIEAVSFLERPHCPCCVRGREKYNKPFVLILLMSNHIKNSIVGTLMQRLKVKVNLHCERPVLLVEVKIGPNGMP